MTRFVHAHATHPDWRMALALAAAQLDAQRSEAGPQAPTLGWVYLTDHYAAQADALVGELKQRWPGVEWVGSVGVGIAATGVEYFDEPALALMLTDLPRAQFRVFSGARPLGGFDAHAALVHADPEAPDLNGLIADMSERTSSGYLFGGLASSRSRALHIAGDALRGGLSGAAFAPGVALVSRVTQGCQPVGRARRVTASDGNIVTRLDGQPALECLLEDIGAPGRDPREVLPTIRTTLVGLRDPADAADGGPARSGAFGPDTRVRHLIGLDPGKQAIAIADAAPVGVQLSFCQRNKEAARRDLVRICAEIREELTPEPAALSTLGGDPSTGLATAGRQIAGAVYVSCSGRGGPHFGAPSAELAVVRHALGEVPLVGFFAAGEIARHHLYGYTGVLTVFTAAA